MDGQLEEGDILPFRIYLSSFTLNPTYALVNNIFSVNYFVCVKITLVNSDYTFMEEIILFR